MILLFDMSVVLQYCQSDCYVSAMQPNHKYHTQKMMALQQNAELKFWNQCPNKSGILSLMFTILRGIKSSQEYLLTNFSYKKYYVIK